MVMLRTHTRPLQFKKIKVLGIINMTLNENEIECFHHLRDFMFNRKLFSLLLGIYYASMKHNRLF